MQRLRFSGLYVGLSIIVFRKLKSFICITLKCCVFLICFKQFFFCSNCFKVFAVCVEVLPLCWPQYLKVIMPSHNCLDSMINALLLDVFSVEV